MLGQVGEGETLFRPLEFDEVAIKLDQVLGKRLRRETQEDRRMAGVALVNEADVLGTGLDDVGGARDRLRRHV